MGYTHYFSHKKDITQDAWEKITRDFELLLSALPEHSESAGGGCRDEPLKIASWQKEAPIIDWDDETIAFNGAPEEMSHETMYLGRSKQTTALELELSEKDKIFIFCKTARKPYDLLVCGLLILVNHYAPNAYEIDSDGDAGDWTPALRWVQKICGNPSRTFGLPHAIGTVIPDHPGTTKANLGILEEWLKEKPTKDACSWLH